MPLDDAQNIDSHSDDAARGVPPAPPRRAFLASAAGWAAGLAAAPALLSLAGCSQGAASSSPTTPRPRPTPRPDDPNTEFRGVWVASVANIDWPSAKGLPPDRLRAEIAAILDCCAAARLNAVILQVRPSCDAIYPSQLEPWSEFLTGAADTPPEPGFDPLREWIEQAHARGIELHAWFNPFRARHHKAEFPDRATHINTRRPDLVRTWGNLKWLDPSEPDARAHSAAVFMDVVTRYDLDGVHIDDYFYPYPREDAQGKPIEFPDEPQWNAYTAGGGTRSRSDWRRAHIDGFIKDLYQRVKAAKPHVMFGISPFGIWRPNNPPGIAGFDAHEGLFADARTWLREGWVDYMAPQLYWSVNAPKQPFGPLLDWWRAENIKNRHIWPGLYTSRIQGEGNWKPDEIEAQIAASRERPTLGHMHFSMIALLQNRDAVTDRLARGLYAQDAIIPPLTASPDPASISVVVSPGQPAESASPTARLWWTARGGAPARRWIVQVRHGSRWTTRAFPPSHTGCDIPLLDAVGVRADKAIVRRIDSTRRFSRPHAVALTALPTTGSA